MNDIRVSRFEVLHPISNSCKIIHEHYFLHAECSCNLGFIKCSPVRYIAELVDLAVYDGAGNAQDDRLDIFGVDFLLLNKSQDGVTEFLGLPAELFVRGYLAFTSLVQLVATVRASAIADQHVLSLTAFNHLRPNNYYLNHLNSLHSDYWAELVVGPP